MAESCERMKRKRSTLRALTTKLLQRIEKMVADRDCNSVELEEALSQLEVKETSLKEIDRNIEEATMDLEELDSEIQAAQEYQDRIIVWKFRAKGRIRSSSEQNHNVDAERIPRQNGNRTPISTVKLPRLNLEKFNGNAEDWQSFWNQFEAAIHKNDSLTNVDKFNYLKTYLSGTASNAVNGLAMTDVNYEVAIKILQDRFGRKDLIVNAHMNRLLNLSPVAKSTEVDALRKLYDICEIQVRSLESLGIVSETYGSLLCPVLMKVIPDDITLEFSRRRNVDMDWNVKELLRFLRVEVECRERARILNKQPQKQVVEKSKSYESSWRDGYKSKDLKPSVPTSATLTTGTDNKCIFCNHANHASGDCYELSVNEKKNKLKAQGRCYVCLGRKHIARYCKSKIPCNKCGRRHHKVICTQSASPSTEQTPKETVISSVSQTENGSENGATILLQTASAIAFGNKGKRMVRCLLDGGSQRTFIKMDVSRSLDLKILGEETLLVHTFGDEEPKSMTLRKVEVYLKGCNDAQEKIRLEALETPSLCGAMISVPGAELRCKLLEKGLTLAEGPQQDMGIPLSILIGGDFYWKVVSGRIERLGGSLVALETKFGWCIQGPCSTSVAALGCNEISIMKIAVQDDITSKSLRDFWELESLGISNDTETMSELNKEALESSMSQIEFKNGRYEVKLPWKQERPALSNNFRIAKSRFLNLVKKFRTDAMFYDRYRNEIEDQLRLEIIEPVPEEEDEGKKYYLPGRRTRVAEVPGSRWSVLSAKSPMPELLPASNRPGQPGSIAQEARRPGDTARL